MTTPGVPAPDGAITGGDLSPLDGLDEASWRSNLESQKLQGFNDAHVSFSGMFQRPFDQMAPISDGQIPLRNRLELLREVTAYGSAVMGKNWKLSSDSVWVDVPFDVQIGPSKHVEVITDPDNPKVGYLQIAGGGLWRADLLMNGQGMTGEGRFITGANGYPEFHWFYYPVRIDYRIVVTQGESLVYRRDYLSAGVPYESRDYSAPVLIPRSASCPATFVFDADLGPATVKVQTRPVPYYSNGLVFGSQSDIAIFGGTEKSALCVTRWSTDDIDRQLVIDPPVGGTL